MLPFVVASDSALNRTVRARSPGQLTFIDAT
jgi:hypothetical protein